MQAWFRQSTNVYGTERQGTLFTAGRTPKDSTIIHAHIHTKGQFQFASPPVLQMHVRTVKGIWRTRTEPTQTWEGRSNSAQPPGGFKPGTAFL